MKIVLQKFIAQSGYCSRRKAENFIVQSIVRVNGKIAELGMRVDNNDEIYIGEKKIGLSEKMIYIKLNKPVGYVCTNRKFKGEKNIFDLVTIDKRLFVVGRLDKNSCGLVLLTNNGDLTQKLTHPSYEHEKEYLVKIKVSNSKIDSENIIKKMKLGIDIGNGDGIVKMHKIEYIGSGNFKIILTQGKKRQIRRMFKELNLVVLNLKRISIGNIELGNLKEKEWRYLRKEEIALLVKN